MTYNAEEQMNKHFLKAASMAYPAEYVIRIFKGNYPRLTLDQSSFAGKKLCDVGCGDGRNLAFLARCGFAVSGMEITADLVKLIKANLASVGVDKSDIKVGKNNSIPFADAEFDYLLSWNACYYMQDSRDFGEYVKEFARVTKASGRLVLSIPKKSCFIFQGSIPNKPGYRTITQDPYDVRVGEVLRVFENEAEIEETFAPYFKNFIFGSIEDDCFGRNYHWHLVVCTRSNA